MSRAINKRGFARKRDENEPEVIEALERIGCTVIPVDKPLDLIVIYGGLIMNVEVKNGNQPPSWQRVTKDQKEFFEKTEGKTKLAFIVNSSEAAVMAVTSAWSIVANEIAAKIVPE